MRLITVLTCLCMPLALSADNLEATTWGALKSGEVTAMAPAAKPAQAATKVPVSFVYKFTVVDPGEVTVTNGNIRHARDNVQTAEILPGGDLSGTGLFQADFKRNNKNGKGVVHGVFELEVRGETGVLAGLEGGFAGSYVGHFSPTDGRDNEVGHGTGDFDGMLLKISATRLGGNQFAMEGYILMK